MHQPVLISGGGIVGTFLGLELSSRNIPFQIIEKTPPKPSELDGIRTLTLNFTVSERLKDLGISIPHSTINKMRVFDGLGTGFLSFHAEDADLDYLASVVDFAELRKELFQNIQDFVIPNKSLESFEVKNSSVQARLDDGSNILSPLVVIAEGRNSKTAEKVSLKKAQTDYHQIARTFLVEASGLKNDTAIQVFNEKEIFALMPFSQSGNYFSVVWSVPESKAKDQGNDLIFKGLNKYEKKLSCSLKPASEILSFPLYSHHLKKYSKEGVCVVADAAHSIHPLAGQGINIGIADAGILAEEIDHAFNRGDSPGKTMYLKNYELRRKSLNASMINGVDLLFRIFQEENPYFRVLRNIGLRGVDRLGFIKKQFILHASGIQKI